VIEKQELIRRELAPIYTNESTANYSLTEFWVPLEARSWQATGSIFYLKPAALSGNLNGHGNSKHRILSPVF
jgi:hypothetical protein